MPTTGMIELMKSPRLHQFARSVLFGLFLFLPLIFTISNDELFEFPKMLLVYASAIVLVGCWAVDSIRSKKVSLPRTPFDIPIMLFLTSQMLSTLFSINMHTSLYGYYSRFNGGLFSTLSYIVLFYSSVYFIGKQHIKTAIMSILAGGVATAIYAFPEHFGHSPSCYVITSKFTADCWVQDVQTRVFGTMGQPNWLAAYLVVLLPLVLFKALSFLLPRVEKAGAVQYLVYEKWSTLYASFAFLSFLLFTTVLFFTKSRSGIVGAGVALALFCGLSIFTLLWKKVRGTQAVGKEFFFLTVLPILFIVCMLTISNPVRDKIFSVLHFSPKSSSSVTEASSPAPTGTQLESGGSESGDIRKVVWMGALKVWLRYPILGSGVETFAYSYYKDRPQEHNLLSEWDFLYNKAHNEFLNYLSTTGALGLVAYCVLIGSFILLPMVWIWKILHTATLSPFDKRSSSYLLSATSSGLLGLAVSNFFGFSTVVVSLLTFILPALCVIEVERHRMVSFSLPKVIIGKWVSRILITVISFTAFYLLLSTQSLYEIDVEYAKGKTLISQSEVTDGVALLQDAVDRFPTEPVYRDELAYTAARLAYALSSTGESTKAADLAQASIDHSDVVIAQNPHNVNFYKTRVRIFTLLARITPVFYDQANQALQKARGLSPTDPKLTYNLALIAKAQGRDADYENLLKDTIALRPIDIQAHLDLGRLYEDQKKPESAKLEYNQVLQLDPKNDEALIRIASLSAKSKGK